MAGILHQFLALSTFQKIALITILFTVAIVISVYFTAIKYPDNLPRYGEKEGATSFSLRTRKAYYTDCKNMFREAYEKYSKHGRTVLLPGIGLRDEIIIPNTALKWLAAQPDHILSSWEAFCEIDQAQYTIGDTKIVSDPWQGLMVKKDMNVILERLMVALEDELNFAFDARFGTNTEWTDITLFGTMKKVVAQASSRFTVGLPMCRNEEYLDSNIAFPDTFVLTAASVGAVPAVLRPILGPLMSIPLRYVVHRIKSSFRPLFQQRLQSLSSPKSEDPQDHLQMMFRYAQTDRALELNIHDMTYRLAMANFGSFHQTSIMATNLIFNVLESDKEYNTIALLREEAERCLKASGGVWTKAVAAQMARADSVNRETMRINAFGNRSLIRKVMVDDLTTEDGILLPKGALVSVLAHPAQCDGDVYDEPLKFDPFRFSRIREQAASDAAEACTENGEKPCTTGNLTVVSTGPQNLIFGHGRHACPGRFLLDFELKMILSYVFTNYDVELAPEYNGKRPESEWVAEAMMPPSKGKIRVKRRAGKS